MITLEDVKRISEKLFMENMDIPNDNRGEDLSEEISQIVFRKDVFECDSDTVVDRHIDIEYSFGECYEVHEETPLFQYICSLSGLSLLQEEREEVVIYPED